MNLDFVLAKNMIWRIRLHGFLRGEETLTLDPIVSHERCSFGKWIYGTALKQYEDNPKIFELEQLHKTLHQHIRQALELKNAKKDSEADAEYLKMVEVSEQIMQLLDELEKVVIQ
jgi:hypothetical protein